MNGKYHNLRRQVKVEKKKNQWLKLSIVVFAIVLLMGVSYAFLSLTLFGEKKLNVIAGTLAVDFKEGNNGITLENTIPTADEEGMKMEPYEFSIENTGTIEAKYDLLIEDDHNEQSLRYEYLKFSLKKNDEEWTTPRLLSDLDSLALEQSVLIEPKEKNHYALKLWLDIDAGNDAQGKKFQGRIVVNVVQSNATTGDITPPMIHLAGNLSMNVEENSAFTDPGVESVTDNKDTLDKNDVRVSYEYYDGETTKTVDGVDTSKRGVYYIYYRISDKSGNEGLNVRSVNVYKAGTEPPVIRLNGDSPMAVEKDATYIDPGATAISGEEDLTSRIVVVGTVNTKRIGSYQVKYLVTDANGNTASIVRVVNVVSTSGLEGEITLDLNRAPTRKITLSGENLGELTYTSNDESIATVDNRGNVTGKKLGETTVTITSSTGLHKTVKVKVQKTIAITYEKGSGISSIGSTSDKCTLTKEESCEITLPSISAGKGYTVSGWYQGESKAGNANDKIEVHDDVTYSARATANTYTIVYHANGGEGNMESQSVKTGESLTIAKNGFTREGYKFLGWTTKADGSDDSYDWTDWSGTWSFDNGEKGIEENRLTLYARWQLDEFTVTYDYATNGGSSASKTSAKVVAGREVDLSVTAEKSGWTFVGWNTNKDATTALSSQVMPSRNLTLYAIFKKPSRTITITFNKNGASTQTNSSGTAVSDTTVTRSCTIGEVYNNGTQATTCNVTSPTIVGSTNTPTVIGYSTAASTHTSSWNHNTSKAVSANATYYAQTTNSAKNITITFNKNGASTQTNSSGTAVGDATVTRACTIAATYNGVSQATTCNVTSPTIVGSTNTPTVIGYSTAASTHTSSWNHNTSKAVSANATYYAQTKKAAVTRSITYKKQGTGVSAVGKTSDSCTIAETYNGVAQGTSCNVVAPSITVVSGYTAVGWSTSSTATTGTGVGKAITLSGNATYYSISYKNAITYSVTFNANKSTINATSKSCTIAAAYNSNAQATSCSITTPTITAPTATPTVIGFNQSASATTSQVGSNATLSVTSSINGKTYYAITRKDAKTVTITFNKNGASTQTNSSGTAVSDTNVTRACTIAATYNGTAQSTTCSVTSPTIVGSTNTPTVVGYSTATGTHTSSWNQKTAKSVSANATYYAQTTKAAKTITITFNKNGAASQTDANGTASTATTVTRACTIAATYNGTAQSTTCSVTSPKIVASSNTPTITGYSTAAGTHSNSWSHNTAKSVSANATYYAQTKKAAVTRSVTYSKGSGVSAIGKTSDSCSIAATYNGTAQTSSCNVTLPSITSLAGYNTGFWSTSSSATSGTSASTSVALSSNRTYYARALDTTRPTVSLASVDNTFDATHDAMLMFSLSVTDTSGSVNLSNVSSSQLSVTLANGKNVTPLFGPTVDTSSATTITNGKKLQVMVAFTPLKECTEGWPSSSRGNIVINVPANFVADESGNGNLATAITFDEKYCG